MNSVDLYIQPGSRIGCIYQVEDIIGQGYTAIILKCRDTKKNRSVAIKRFFPEKMTRQLKEKVYAEPHLNIRSEYVVTAEEIFEENGVVNMVMQYIAGDSLRELLDKYDGLNEIPAIYIALCIARACIDIHSSNILSTDIKPENIMILPNMKAQLIDFSCFERKGCKAELSLGTIPYSCPELLRHERLNESTDTFSIGVILFEMLAGSEKFNQITENWEQTLQKSIKPNTSIVKATFPKAARIINKALEPCPEHRYTKSLSLFNDLSEYFTSLTQPLSVVEKSLYLIAENGKQLRIREGKYVVGRNNINAFNYLISERHFEITFNGTRAQIKDAGSRNGTLINGKRLNGRWVNLHDTDVISIADVNLIARLP